MEILHEGIIRFTNSFNPNGYIDLIEEVSSTVYPLETVDRRPHLTMSLPTLFSMKDNIPAIKLRSKCISDMMNPISQYMSLYNIDKMIPKKDFITVSKMIWHSSMAEHVDDNEINSKNFIIMAYLNNNFSGGELYFPDLDIKYSPTPGDIVIYPAKQKHMVLDLTQGFRYTFGYGLKGPIND